MSTKRNSVHYQVFMRGRGWCSLWVSGTELQRQKWVQRQKRLRDVIQIKVCDGCGECEEEGTSCGSDLVS